MRVVLAGLPLKKHSEPKMSYKVQICKISPIMPLLSFLGEKNDKLINEVSNVDKPKLGTQVCTRFNNNITATSAREYSKINSEMASEILLVLP